MTVDVSRRAFLLQSGLLGAGLAISPEAMTATLPARERMQVSPELALTILDELTLDTFRALAAFVTPGNDDYSLAQGVSSPQPGGVAAKAPELAITDLNRYVPFPVPGGTAFLHSLAASLRVGSVDVTPELSAVADGDGAAALDAAVTSLIDEGRLQLAGAIALLLNILASLVNPRAQGAGMSLYARLTWHEKGLVVKKLEELSFVLQLIFGPLLTLVGEGLGLLSGTLLTITGFQSFSETGVLDPDTRTLLARPVGWDISGYRPDGPVEGWDDFRGYFQGRREVDA